MQRAPSILFVHDSYPGQFGKLCRHLGDLGWEVAFATASPPARPDGVRILPYAPHRAASPQTHPYAQPMDRAALKAQAFARTALAARRDGYRPDVIVAHSGWGAGMFAKDIFPKAKFIAYCEWWYRFPGADVAYLEALGYPLNASVEAPLRERARNAPIALDLSAADLSVCPTAFQAAQFPEVFRRALTVLHDGIDTDHFIPDPSARRSQLGGLLPESAHVVTYATRGMEPHRGFPQFMASLPSVFAADRKAVAIVAGENRTFYGGDALRKTDWKARSLEENDIDPARIHFVGRLDGQDYLDLLRRSDAHVYLTVPFVLSWSMLEAMSVGCPLILSGTDPVLEFASAKTATIVDMAEPSVVASAILKTLADRSGGLEQREGARETVRERACSTPQMNLWRTLF